MSGFETFKERLLNKEKFYGSVTSKKIVLENELVLINWDIFKMKTIKDYNKLY